VLIVGNQDERGAGKLGSGPKRFASGTVVCAEHAASQHPNSIATAFLCPRHPSIRRRLIQRPPIRFPSTSFRCGNSMAASSLIALLQRAAQTLPRSG
jgi:hypothetical protein